MSNKIRFPAYSISAESPQSFCIPGVFPKGQSGDSWEAREGKGVDLSKFDFVVMSHRHGDHMGGLPDLLQVDPSVKIYAPKENWGVYGADLPSTFYRKDPSLPREQRYYDGGPARNHAIWVRLARGEVSACRRLGLLGALSASRLLRSFLFEVSPFDPVVLAASDGAMLILALVAPALSAKVTSSTDPMPALRSE